MCPIIMIVVYARIMMYTGGTYNICRISIIYNSKKRDSQASII